MDLFDYMAENQKESPLAMRLRPEIPDEIVGQEHILGENKLLRRAILQDSLSSLILFGPPGTGKTTIASVIAKSTSSEFLVINASTSGKKDMEEAVDKAKGNQKYLGKKTILFIDEIHRFNKAQQDYLLPFIEDGTVILIGATTENPYYEVNKALLSRSTVFELYPLREEAIRELIIKALTDKEKGLGLYQATITDGALNLLSSGAGGDARYALNVIENAVLTSRRTQEVLTIDENLIAECMGRKANSYDKNADSHYDVISAFIKSMRGSDPNGTVYYLARMIAGGEDIRFIARRIMICASEDVGNADPQALVIATAAADASDRVGLPEARIILSQAALYVACAPKSNASYLAIDEALELVEHTNYRIPAYLRSQGYKRVTSEEDSKDYKYPHDYENHFVEQQYLPSEIKDRVFYHPALNTAEEEKLKRIRNIKNWDF